MKRIRRAALAVATALVAVLVTALPASATTTKTNGPFTMHVVGTKLHVDYFWFSETLTGGQTFHGDFWVEIDSPSGERALYSLTTHSYRWHDSDNPLDPDRRTFSTGHYKVDRSFPNNSLGFSGVDQPSGDTDEVRFTVHT
jgi:hypothetical protein